MIRLRILALEGLDGHVCDADDTHRHMEPVKASHRKECRAVHAHLSRELAGRREFGEVPSLGAVGGGLIALAGVAILQRGSLCNGTLAAVEEGVIILRGAPKQSHMGTFRQDQEFYYLTGVNEADVAVKPSGTTCRATRISRIGAGGVPGSLELAKSQNARRLHHLRAVDYPPKSDQE